jgi:hypothetical protein
MLRARSRAAIHVESCKHDYAWPLLSQVFERALLLGNEVMTIISPVLCSAVLAFCAIMSPPKKQPSRRWRA